MLSAIILAADARLAPVAPDALVRTLAALVPAAIEGLVRDVTIAGLAGRELASIADHAGCELTEGDDPSLLVAQALKLARGPNVFLLRAGRAPEAGFIDEIGDFLARSDAGARGALMRETPETFLTRTIPALSPAVGLIASRQRMMDAKRADLAGLVRALRPAVTLRARGRRVD
jgi:hypothetical protein